MRRAFARGQAQRILLTTNWMAETGQKQGQEVVDRYAAVTQLQPDWESGYFHLGKYFDLLLNTRVAKLQAQLVGVCGGMVTEAWVLVSSPASSVL